MRLFCGSALGHHAFDDLIDNDTAENHHADDGVLEVGGDAEQIDGVSQQAKDRRADDHSEDGSLPSAQTAPAQHGGGDGEEFVKLTGLRRLHRVQFVGKEQP